MRSRPEVTLTLTISRTIAAILILIGLFLALTLAMWRLPFKDESSFERPIAPPAHEVSIIAFGDQGSADFRQRRVAALLESACRAVPSLAFVQTLGDNFYSHGVKSLDDPQWHNAFQSIYDTPCLESTVFHAALGNHDEEGDPAVQVAYTKSGTGPVKWYMPNNYYVSRAGTAAGGRPMVTVLVVDTGMPLDDQIALMDKTFAEPHGSLWRVVAGHHNVRTESVRYHNDDRLRRRLLPALVRNHVDFYLAGHSHSLQLIEHPDEPVYVVAGGGGKRPRPLIKDAANNSLLAQRALGFVELWFSDTSAMIAFTATSGRLFSTFSARHYRFTVSRQCLDARHHSHCVRPLPPAGD